MILLHKQAKKLLVLSVCLLVLALVGIAQLTDRSQTGAGIPKTLAEQIGAGRGDIATPGSSLFIIKRDPFRAILRGRQLFQRRFTEIQGLGPSAVSALGAGMGDIAADPGLGNGFMDSCAGCHSQPHGSAGFGGATFVRPDHRAAVHLFGMGLVEMLGDEITSDLRALREQASTDAQSGGEPVRIKLESKGISYGHLTAMPDGSVDVSEVSGVNPDLRVRPFFAEGSSFSIRETVVLTMKGELGMEAIDPDLAAAAAGGVVTTPAGIVLDGTRDTFAMPPALEGQDPDGDGVQDEFPTALVDYMEFYHLNYFKPGLHEQTSLTRRGLQKFQQIGCNECHRQTLVINHDRRVADVETNYDPENGVFNNLFAVASPLLVAIDDGMGFPPLKEPAGGEFVVENIFADFRRHDLGPAFWERNFDGSINKEFMTEPLWGVGTTGPYGHDGRSLRLKDVILRHGGEAEESKEQFERLSDPNQQAIIAFLSSLVIFPPPDTASNLDPADPTHLLFPQFGHGSIKLSVLFNDPSDPE